MHVAIVGAGPAGASAARALASAGIRATIFEKADWPRHKACGDGLTPASMRELRASGIALDSWARFGKTLVSGPDERLFVAGWPPGQADGTTMVRRDFDDLLVARAVASGAAFEPSATVLSCGDGVVQVRSNQQKQTTIRCDAVFLGEGASGGLGARCGMPPHRYRMPAFRAYVAARTATEPAYQVHYARGIVPGYAWIFPGPQNRLNIGIMATKPCDVRARLQAWLRTSSTAALSVTPNASIENGAGGVIPVGRPSRIANNVFAIGDAAGVADPLSGEGISQAMISGRLAAEALVSARGNIRRAATAYAQALDAFDHNNREAFRMRALFGAIPRPFFWFAARRPRFANQIIASGYFQKRDASWFTQAVAAALAKGAV